MDWKTLTYEERDGVGVIGLNRPERRNAINTELLSELGSLLDVVAADDEVSAVVLTGGEAFFAAGADLGEVNRIGSVADGFEFGARAQAVFRKLAELPQPVIAAVSGLALGGGCELCLACDVRIAAEGAKFGLPEVTLGLLPGAGGTQRLPRLVGVGCAKELLFSGEPVDAHEAWRIGLVNRVVPADALLETALQLARTFAKRPRFALRTIKRLVNEGIGVDLRTALAMESIGFGALFGTEDQKEGVRAFVAKRKPSYTGR